MSAAAVQTISPMSYPRIFANAVVLPTGAVFISGGQNYGIPFSDNGSQLQPEMWDPVSTTFTKLAPQAIPRNYHSIGLLLPDATILSAGGGLCGACATNHYDGQIYSPSYLFTPNGSRATRPVIESAPAQVSVGGTLTATTNAPVTAWAMLRLGATTRRSFSRHFYSTLHADLSLWTDTVNTDQRRIPLNATANGTTYTMTLPADPGVLIPGYYYLFAMNAAVPSLAKFVSVPVP